MKFVFMKFYSEVLEMTIKNTMKSNSLVVISNSTKRKVGFYGINASVQIGVLECMTYHIKACSDERVGHHCLQEKIPQTTVPFSFRPNPDSPIYPTNTGTRYTTSSMA